MEEVSMYAQCSYRVNTARFTCGWGRTQSYIIETMNGLLEYMSCYEGREQKEKGENWVKKKKKKKRERERKSERKGNEKKYLSFEKEKENERLSRTLQYDHKVYSTAFIESIDLGR